MAQVAGYLADDWLSLKQDSSDGPVTNADTRTLRFVNSHSREARKMKHGWTGTRRLMGKAKNLKTARWRQTPRAVPRAVDCGG
jgi:hypothetical protein